MVKSCTIFGKIFKHTARFLARFHKILQDFCQNFPRSWQDLARSWQGPAKSLLRSRRIFARSSKIMTCIKARSWQDVTQDLAGILPRLSIYGSPISFFRDITEKDRFIALGWSSLTLKNTWKEYL